MSRIGDEPTMNTKQLIKKANDRIDEIKKESAKLMNLTSQLESLELISDFQNKRIYIADSSFNKPIDVAAVLDENEDIQKIKDFISKVIDERVMKYEKELSKMITTSTP